MGFIELDSPSWEVGYPALGSEEDGSAIPEQEVVARGGPDFGGLP